MTYRPRPDRRSLVLAAVDLALSDEVDVPEPDRAGVLELLLEALGVPERGIESSVYELDRPALAEELVDAALILDEADVTGLDGELLRAACRPGATLDQRESQLDYTRRTFERLVIAAGDSLPPSTVRRP